MSSISRLLSPLSHLIIIFFLQISLWSNSRLRRRETETILCQSQVFFRRSAVRCISLSHLFFLFFLFPYISLFLSHKFIPNCNSPSCRHLPSRCISLKWFISLLSLFCAEHTFSVIRNCTIFFFL